MLRVFVMLIMALCLPLLCAAALEEGAREEMCVTFVCGVNKVKSAVFDITGQEMFVTYPCSPVGRLPQKKTVGDFLLDCQLRGCVVLRKYWHYCVFCRSESEQHRSCVRPFVREVIGKKSLDIWDNIDADDGILKQKRFLCSVCCENKEFFCDLGSFFSIVEGWCRKGRNFFDAEYPERDRFCVEDCVQLLRLRRKIRWSLEEAANVRFGRAKEIVITFTSSSKALRGRFVAQDCLVDVPDEHSLFAYKLCEDVRLCLQADVERFQKSTRFSASLRVAEEGLNLWHKVLCSWDVSDGCKGVCLRKPLVARRVTAWESFLRYCASFVEWWSGDEAPQHGAVLMRQDGEWVRADSVFRLNSPLQVNSKMTSASPFSAKMCSETESHSGSPRALLT